MAKNNIGVFLDSGAFSAFSRGVNINIQDYIEFIKRWEKNLDLYANLDVIGDPEATLKNQAIMEKAGLDPLPCFHRGEDFKYLRRYIKDYEYIALGGVAVDKDRSNLHHWLDDCWDIICDTKDGMPKVKVHGFAITSIDVMTKYPWYSVDSTSWVLTGRFGSIYVPRMVGGKYVYDANSWKISVSSLSPAQQYADQHFITLPPSQQKAIIEYVESKGFKMGKSEFKWADKKNYKLKDGEKWANQDVAALLRKMIVEDGIYVKPTDLVEPNYVEIIVEAGVTNDYKQRDAMNIVYFVDLEKSIPKWPWAYKRKGPAPFGLRGQR